MKCLVKTCKNTSLLMTVELCYPCSQIVEKGAGNEFKPENELDVNKVTRLEIIDENGRSYTKYKISHIKFSLQDDDRTLKIFLEVKNERTKTSS